MENKKKRELLPPEILEERAKLLSQKRDLDSEQRENMGQSPYLLLEVASNKFALFLEDIIEIVPNSMVTPIPGTPQALAGVLNLRGTIIDIVNLRILFELSFHSSMEKGNPILVCDFKENYFGLQVDRIIGIISLSPDKIKATPDPLGEEIKKYIHGVAFQDLEKQNMVYLLEIEKIFLSPKFDSVRGQKK